MGLSIVEKKREISSSRFELDIQWVLDGPHRNGLLVQKVTRNDRQLQSFQNVTATATVYWEAWVIQDYKVYGVNPLGPELIPLSGNVYHDTFAGPASGVGGTRIIGDVYWIDKESPDYLKVLNRMPPGGVPDAAFLFSTYNNPFDGVVPTLMRTRDEFFLYEVF